MKSIESHAIFERFLHTLIQVKHPPWMEYTCTQPLKQICMEWWLKGTYPWIKRDGKTNQAKIRILGNCFDRCSKT